MKEFYLVFSFLLGFVIARFFSAPHWLNKKRSRATPAPRKHRPISFRISK